MNYKPQTTIFIILFKFKKSDLLTFQFDFGDHLENLRQYRVNRKMSYRGGCLCYVHCCTQLLGQSTFSFVVIHTYVIQIIHQALFK